MRFLLRILFPLLLVTSVSQAQDGFDPDFHEDAEGEPQVEMAPDALPQPEGAPSQSRLDRLFADLKRERNERSAGRIANTIWAEWLKSGSASVDLMMKWSNDAAKAEKYDVALDFLDQVIVLDPDYAEAWNRRATVHFQMNNYAMAMSDLQRTLQLEPRHFGALTGMAAIMRGTGRDRLALDAYMRALDVYPMLRSAQREAGRLADELADSGA